MKTCLGVWVVLIGIVLPGCAVPPTARVPEIPANADENARRALYEQYKLTGHVGAFAATWKRADGEYGWAALEKLSKEYSATEDVYGRAQTRGTALGVVGGVGGGLVGATFGRNLGASDENRLPRDTQIALYATGGGLIVVSLIMSAVWHNPAEDFAETYNAALRRELGLPEPAGKPALASSNWVPRPVGRGYGWRF